MATHIQSSTISGSIRTVEWSELLDEDDFASDSDVNPPSQQSVKAYVDANAGGITAGKAIALSMIFG